MFEKIFTYSWAIRRHEFGPMSSERKSILCCMHENGYCRLTLQSEANYLLRAAQKIISLPRKQVFTEDELLKVANGNSKPSERRYHNDSSQRLFIAMKRLLSAVNRIHRQYDSIAHYSDMVEDFLATLHGKSPKSISSYRWLIRNFLLFTVENKILLESLSADTLDSFFESKKHLSKITISHFCLTLRRWLVFCGQRNICQAGLEQHIIFPRIYRFSEIPSSFSWDAAKAMIDLQVSENPKARLRDRAIMLLLTTYGIRASELCNLTLDAIDWDAEIITFFRFKTHSEDAFLLDLEVGNAIIDYLLHERPQTDCRFLFLSSRRPYKQVTNNVLFGIVRARHKKLGITGCKHGPHSIRHTVACHLLKENTRYNEISNFLGHRELGSTAIYAKADFDGLKSVAMQNMEDLI